MAFTCFNRNIRDEAHDKIRELGPSGVQAFAFTPSGGWVIVTNGGLFARNIPRSATRSSAPMLATATRFASSRSRPRAGTGG